MKSAFFFVGLLAGFSFATTVEQHGNLVPRGAAPPDTDPEPPRKRCTYQPTNPRGNVVCGKYGSLTDPKPLGDSFLANSADLCRNRCFRGARCKSFGYTEASGSCQLYSDLLTRQGYKRAQSGPTIFYNRRCFKRDCRFDCDDNSSQGVQFAVYHNDQGPSDGPYDFDPTVYKTVTPLYNNVTGFIGGISNPSQDDSTVQVYDEDHTFNHQYLVIDHRAYLKPNASGTWTFRLGDEFVDEIFFFWFGQKAYSGWTKENSDLSFQGMGTTNSFATEVVAGQFYPFRILWANAQGGAEFNEPEIFGPDENAVLSSSTPLNEVVVQCNSKKAPPFPEFGFE